MAIAELSIIPVGTASASISRYVAQVHRVLAEEKDILFSLTPMSTVLEGNLDTVFAVVRKLHELPFALGAARVYTVLKIDDRRDRQATMEQKIRSVAEKLQDQETGEKK